ncbi:hypothetical protein GNZ11_33080 [Paraburkholderia xenovorans]|nr:hypothetical protein [Paraburkholderia xenovorans]
MSCAARYSETTSLEFILNPFKFFFTNYVAKIAPHSPPDIPHLETKFRPPTILHSYRSDCGHAPLPLHSCLDAASALSRSAAQCSCHTVLRQPLRSSNNPTAASDSVSAHTHFVAESADVWPLSVSSHFFHQRATQAFGLHKQSAVTC